MLKVKRKIFYTALISIIMIISAFFAFTPTEAIGKAYAYDMDKRLTLNAEMVNNVILFAFKEDADLVVNNGVYTSRTYDFINKFDDRLNNNEQSLQKYYKAMSNGKFTIKSNLVMNDNGTPNNTSDDKPFVVIVDEAKANCVDTNKTAQQNVIKTILSEFSNASTTAILDESANCNNDDFIDILTFVCLDFDTENNMSGKDYNTANKFMINEYNGNICWPHRTSYSQGGLNFGKNNEYKLNQYLVMPSVQFTANTSNSLYNNYLKSTFFHEVGHGLGLPDMYVVDKNELEYVGLWDIMGINYMQSLSACSKNMLGWLSGNEFTKITNEGTYTLKPSYLNELNTKNGKVIDLNSTIAYYIEDPEDSNQMIIFEYRDLTNYNTFDNNINHLRFEGDSTGLTSGLTIYRINKNYNDNNRNLILQSNYENKASIFYFRNADNLKDRSTLAFKVGDTFGVNEGNGASSQSDINTNYISFARTSGGTTVYKNSNLCIEVLSMDSESGLTFKVTGGNLKTGATPIDETLAKNVILDNNLLMALSDFMGISKDELTTNDLSGIAELDLNNKGITDLTGLSMFYMPALRTLILNGNQITAGLEELSTFTSITNLQMADCGLTDISFVDTLTNLAYINFSLNEISDFTNLNPKTKSKLIFANIVLNNLDTSLSGNNFLLSGSYSDKFAIGIQNFPMQPTSTKPKTIYYSSFGLPSTLVLNLSNNSINYSLNEGENILGDGHYTLTYAFNDTSIAQAINKTITIDVIVVTVKQPIVELLVGDIYQNDTTASFDGWKSSYSYKATIMFNGEIVDFVDTSFAGTYFITFNITINANTSLTLTKQVIVYEDKRIPFGEDGIKDKNLYIELLKLVGKGATRIDNIDTVDTTADNTLYSQDLYFYGVNGVDAEVTELNLANKKITDLTGIGLVNLKKITVINFNQNSIVDISPLFEQGNEAMPNLEELHLAGLGLTSLPTSIGSMYSLKKIDLSFNRLTRVDALKPLVIPSLLQNAGKEQMLQLVNLNMNNISFSTSGAYVENESGEMEFVQDANYAVFNDFTLDRTITPGYKSGNQIFILMIQNLQNNISYINEPTFDYYNTEANTQTRKGKTEYIFIIKVGNTNVMDNWSNKSPKNIYKNSGSYNVTFSINGTNPFKLAVSNATFKRTFYVTTISIKTLKEINKKDFMLEDKWNIPSNIYAITSTERIANPSESDLNISSSISNRSLTGTIVALYIRVNSSGQEITNVINLNSDESYNLFPYTYEIMLYYRLAVTGTGIKTAIFQNFNVSVKIYRNEKITITDEKLNAKMHSILNKKEGEQLYAYDTYQLKNLNLSNSQIESINNPSGGNGFTSFHFDNLSTLNLSKNNISHINFDSMNFKALTYLDLSFNSLCDATELKRIHSTSSIIYVLASNNLYNFNVDSTMYGTYAEGNMWLIRDSAKYGNIEVIVGIQGINSTSTNFVTFAKEIEGVNGATAGFYYIPTSTFEAKTFNATGTTNDVRESDKNYQYNYYYYYKDAGNYTINFNFSFSNFSFNYQGTVSHGKIYIENDENRTYIVDYDKNDSEKTKQTALDYDCFTYENCTADDFIRTYSLCNYEDSLIDEIKIDVLTTYKQSITLTHKESGTSAPYTKIIKVLDREKPIITMDESQKFVQTLINTPYSWFSRGGIDRDISATDNYDDLANISFKAIIYKEGDENPIDKEYVPIDKPGIYTIIFTATDSSGNESDPIVRKVRVFYADYTIVKLTKPSAALSTGNAPFRVTVYRLENRDPNPTFHWYVDGKYIKSSTIDEDSIDSKVAITSTVDLPFDTAGKHIVTVKINELESEDFVVEPQSSNVEYFVLLDNNVKRILLYIAIGVVVVFIVIYVVIRFIRKKKAEKLSKYEYNLISKK